MFRASACPKRNGIPTRRVRRDARRYARFAVACLARNVPVGLGEHRPAFSFEIAGCTRAEGMKHSERIPRDCPRRRRAGAAIRVGLRSGTHRHSRYGSARPMSRDTIPGIMHTVNEERAVQTLPFLLRSDFKIVFPAVGLLGVHPSCVHSERA